MKRFLTFKKKIQPVIVFDIGSASIGAAVVFFEKEVPHIAYCTRVNLPFLKVAKKKHLLSQIEEILTQIAHDIQKNGLQIEGEQAVVPRKIVCIFSPLWSNTQTTCASFEAKKRFRVTDQIMDNLLAQIHKESKENNKKKGGSMEVIEEIVISTLLNGYPTDSPLGKETQSIEVTYFESVITKTLHEKISSTIHKTFSPDIPLLFRSLTLVSFTVVRDLFEDIKDFLLIDVTGEITELAVVRNSILEDTISFPYGRNTLVRNIAKKTRSIPEDVLSRVTLALFYTDAQTGTDSENTSEIKELLSKEEKLWTEMFGKACDEISSEVHLLPQDVFLIADGEYTHWFSRMIERVDFSQFTPTREAFLVHTLTGEHLEDVCTHSDGVTRDNFLIIGSLLHHRKYLS